MAARKVDGTGRHMAHPLATKAIAAGRVKNDAVDARMLAHLLRANLLPEAWIAPPEAREARRLVRMRASLVRLSSRLKCQIHALLADYGVNPELTDVFGQRGRQIMAELRLPEISQHRLEVNLRLIDSLAQEVKAADQLLKQRFGRDPRALRLLPIPGIGLFTSATVVAEVWDIRFPSARLVGGPDPARTLQRRPDSPRAYLQAGVALAALGPGRGSGHSRPPGPAAPRALSTSPPRQ